MTNKSKLGNWALIDIETTGIDPAYDEIIDLGFLQFEGTKLIKTYDSLVCCENPPGPFIQKLTGIKPEDLKRAPRLDKVVQDLWDLSGHRLVAHNAAFEEKFLAKHFEALEPREESETYCDSLLYLSLVYPERSHLNLDSFIVEFNIAPAEEHRAFADSRDLLKVMLMATYLTHFDSELRAKLKHEMQSLQDFGFWFSHFYSLDAEELLDIAGQIDFNLDALAQDYMHNKVMQEDDLVFDNTSTENEFSARMITDLFKDEEKMRQKLAHYQARQSQIDLALRVGQAFKNQVHAMAQAPTGTGKTLAYLIPSMLFAKESGEQVLVSTGTKTLQAQAMQKDIPLVRKILNLPSDKLKVERLVGSSNHLCELSFWQHKENITRSLLNDFDKQFALAFLEMAFFYNKRASDDRFITRDDLPYVLKKINPEFDQLQDEIKVDYRSCISNKCPHKNECTYLQGLRKAKEADIIVGNHALCFTWPRSMPRPSYVVMDEAHKLEEEATKSFALELSQKDLEGLAKNTPSLMGPLFYLLGLEEGAEDLINDLRKKAQEVASVLMDHLPALKEVMELFFQKSPRYTELYWNELPMPAKEGLQDSQSAAIYNHLDSLNFVLKSFYADLAKYLNKWTPEQLKEDQGLMAYSSFESFVANIEDAAKAIEHMVEEKENYVASLRYHVASGYLLQASPVDVGKVIYENLLETSLSVVMTSATLANANGSIGVAAAEWMTGHSYIEPPKRFQRPLFLKEVYDYQNQAKVFVASDVPKIYENSYVEKTLQQIVPLIRKLEGRTLLLYSSRVRFEKATEKLLLAFEGEIPVFIQGMGNRVVDDFKASEHGILVGMESFGEGIDIPGDTLQLVYIDKVPDLRQDLVIQKRREFYQRSFGNEFTDYFLGHRGRSLHQKLGRLLRSENDRGAVIITDPRLASWKKRTLSTFSELMGPYQLEFCPLKNACDEALDFIRSDLRD